MHYEFSILVAKGIAFRWGFFKRVAVSSWKQEEQRAASWTVSGPTKEKGKKIYV